VSVERGEGWAVAHLDDLGSGPGFRKIRKGLDVRAFGANAIVLPPDYTTPRHAHERQEEVYFVHAGTVEIEFGDGTRHRLGPGGVARVDASTVRCLHNAGDDEAVVVAVGGEGGYVGRDGVRPDGDV
jgi:mannose-6-phosphate isomerase-like protein (cupin superfamily)